MHARMSMLTHTHACALFCAGAATHLARPRVWRWHLSRAMGIPGMGALRLQGRCASLGLLKVNLAPNLLHLCDHLWRRVARVSVCVRVCVKAQRLKWTAGVFLCRSLYAWAWAALTSTHVPMFVCGRTPPRAPLCKGFGCFQGRISPVYLTPPQNFLCPLGLALPCSSSLPTDWDLHASAAGFRHIRGRAHCMDDADCGLNLETTPISLSINADFTRHPPISARTLMSAAR